MQNERMVRKANLCFDPFAAISEMCRLMSAYIRFYFVYACIP